MQSWTTIRRPPNKGARDASLFSIPRMIRVQRPASQVAAFARVGLAQLLSSAFAVVVWHTQRRQTVKRWPCITASADRDFVIDLRSGLGLAFVQAELA